MIGSAESAQHVRAHCESNPIVRAFKTFKRKFKQFIVETKRICLIIEVKSCVWCLRVCSIGFCGPGGVTGKERSLWLACRPGLIAGGNQIREGAYGADLQSHLHDSAGRVTRRWWQKGRTGGKRSKGKRSSNVREEEQLGYSWIRKQSRGQRERGATSGLVAIFTEEDNWDLLQISCCVFLRRLLCSPVVQMETSMCVCDEGAEFMSTSWNGLPLRPHHHLPQFCWNRRHGRDSSAHVSQTASHLCGKKQQQQTTQLCIFPPKWC